MGHLPPIKCHPRLSASPSHDDENKNTNESCPDKHYIQSSIHNNQTELFEESTKELSSKPHRLKCFSWFRIQYIFTSKWLHLLLNFALYRGCDFYSHGLITLISTPSFIHYIRSFVCWFTRHPGHRE